MGFGGAFGGSLAEKADGTDVWAQSRRSEQLARRERDWAANTTPWEWRMLQHGSGRSIV